MARVYVAPVGPNAEPTFHAYLDDNGKPQRCAFGYTYEDVKGGYWVSPEGYAYPVEQRTDHGPTLSILLPELGQAYPDYEEGYNRGWVRISFCGCYGFNVSFQKEASKDAMRAAIKIMRRPPKSFEDCRAELTTGCYDRFGRKDWVKEAADCRGMEPSAALAKELADWLVQREAAARITAPVESTIPTFAALPSNRVADAIALM